jgi:hypothetical protein
MTNPRNFEPHPSLTRKRAVESLYRSSKRSADRGRPSSPTPWIIAAIFVVVILGFFVVGHRVTKLAAGPNTTLGESARPITPVREAL